MKTQPYRYTDFDQATKERAEILLQQMTLEEKVGQMNQVNRSWGENLEQDIHQGRVGSMLNVWDIADINRFQKIAVEESRLGIPLITGTDVIHGYRTIFPIPLAESCTWDPDLLEKASRVAADEAAASGTDWIFAPMIDIARDPRWGRIAEGAGEDPFLGAAMARARVRGFQSPNLAGGKRIVACPKHYIAYGAAEAGKDYNTVDISNRTLHEVYLPPYIAAFDAGAGSVMSSFNEIAGVPVSGNAYILRTLLRDELNFPGVVLSDFDAIGELVQHGFAANLKHAALRAVLAGEDIDMMTGAFHRYLADLVREGLVPEAIVDDAVRRILRMKLALGIFESPYTDPALEAQTVLRDKHLALALEVAQKSIVLLKNEDQLLPVRPEGQRIALIGPLADDTRENLGSWSCRGRAEEGESVLHSFSSLLPTSTILTYVKGCNIEGDDDLDIGAAVTAALSADLAVLVLGESAMMSGEAHSLAHLGLPGHQQLLLEAVVATGTPTVVVLMSGRPLVIPWIAEHVPAILQAWQGGTRAGHAVVGILLGHVNPSGKLTTSFPRTEGQIPVYYAHKSTGRPINTRGVIQFNRAHKTKYLDESHLPQFGFGYGLSYTSYNYTDIVVETPEVTLDGTLKVSACITNTGSRAGEEIVQLYVQDVVGEVTRPVKELKGFQKIHLNPGEKQTVHFAVPASTLGFYGLDMKYKVEAGDFMVWVGPNAYKGLKAQFQLVGGK
ncbi:MAG: glycoside hydrolase family 3 N-terminal domain-containing protein [Anaerolineae bacterium]|nr:glycoside hydrolase family 3 N-terminal domain-containing protein [Anaerolineae bacterium]